MEPVKKPLSKLLEEAKVKFESMSPEEREAMFKAQRDGWVKAEIQWAKDFREGRCKYD